MCVSYCVFQVAATAAAEPRRVYEALFLGKERGQKLELLLLFFYFLEWSSILYWELIGRWLSDEEGLSMK